MSIRDAHRAERELLEDLQRRASLHSSPYRDQLLEHPDAIELPATQIDDGLVRVAERSGVPVGFHVLTCVVDGACELELADLMRRPRAAAALAQTGRQGWPCRRA